MNERIKLLVEQAGIAMIPNSHPISITGLTTDLEKFAELILAEAFRAGMCYSAKKYAAVSEDRFTGNDVAMFLEMEAAELSDDEIKEHFGINE